MDEPAAPVGRVDALRWRLVAMLVADERAFAVHDRHEAVAVLESQRRRIGQRRSLPGSEQQCCNQVESSPVHVHRAAAAGAPLTSIQ